MDYEKKVREQIAQYSNNALRFFPPPVHWHWMHNYMLNKVREVFDVNDALGVYLAAVPSTSPNPKILSVGSGDGQLEIKLAERLAARGQDNFEIHITELSPIRQERTLERIRQAGFEERFKTAILDFNKEFVDGSFDMIFAHHVLHHIVELEFLFDNIARALAPNGCFATIDMIGRNGHMRWPEALEYIQLAWGFIPDHWKHNFQFNDYHAEYLNHDCAQSGFEGIRAQDILPLLTEKFAFTKFAAGGGFVDILFERGYGQSIDMDNPKERALVDFLSQTNELLLETGKIKPTMLFAHMKRKSETTRLPRFYKNMSPGFALREPEAL